MGQLQLFLLVKVFFPNFDFLFFYSVPLASYHNGTCESIIIIYTMLSNKLVLLDALTVLLRKFDWKTGIGLSTGEMLQYFIFLLFNSPTCTVLKFGQLC